MPARRIGVAHQQNFFVRRDQNPTHPKGHGARETESEMQNSAEEAFEHCLYPSLYDVLGQVTMSAKVKGSIALVGFA